MVIRRTDSGVTLTELVVVLALLGVVITAVFTTVQVLSGSASATNTNSAAANDLSYTMELLAKNIMGAKLLYASDQRIVVLAHREDGSHEVEAIYATGSSTPSATVGQLVWERWSSDASATAIVGGIHNVWVMSESNANVAGPAPTALFTYYKSASDSSIMATTAPDMSATPDASLSTFMGTLPGGYNVSAIGRVRLTVAARFSEGVRTNSRDIVLRVR